jgi:hypothetical protein
MKMVLAGDATPARIDFPLLKAIARARRWSNELIAGTVASVDELAKREHLDRRSVRRQIRLGFLSPRIVEAIALGHQPPELNLFALVRQLDLPLLWSAQKQGRREYGGLKLYLQGGRGRNRGKFHSSFRIRMSITI